MTARTLLDTSVLIDYLRGVPAAAAEVDRIPRPCISVVTWIEVLVGTASVDEDARLRRFLSGFEVLPVTAAVAEASVRIRKARRIRLPDAIIGATAEVAELELVTRNERDFPQGAGVRWPYRL